MKYYRVQYGYGKDDFYSVSEEDVAKAIRAQVKGTVFICDEGTVAGNSIVAIKPDYNRVLGYNRDYQMTGEDYNELPPGTKHEHTQLLDDIQDNLSGNNPQLHD